MPKKIAAITFVLIAFSVMSVPLTLAQEDGHPDQPAPDTSTPPTSAPTPVDDPTTPVDESQTPTAGTQTPRGIGEGEDNVAGTQENQGDSTTAQPLDVVPIVIVVAIAGVVGGAIAVFRKLGKSGEYVAKAPDSYPDAPPSDPTNL